MKTSTTIIALIVLVIIAVLLSLAMSSRPSSQADKLDQENNPGEENEIAMAELFSFSWNFEEAPTMNLDGNPQTDVFLIATYENNMTEEKLVDTVDGGCSEMVGESYEGDISNTGKVQCYGAGLGQQYRIVAGEDAYLVERKLFEEALPNYEMPDYEWGVVAEFSLAK